MARASFVGKLREFVANALGGVRGRQNLAAWGVAGTAAYFMWIRPEMKAKEEGKMRAALWGAERRGRIEGAKEEGKTRAALWDAERRARREGSASQSSYPSS